MLGSMIAMTPTVKLPLRFDAVGLRADLATIAPEMWVHHFNRRDYEGEWHVVPLRSVAGRSRHIYSDPVAKPADFAPTPLLEHCPAFREVLETFRCDLLSVRLMSLGPGSRIKEHQDYTIDYQTNDARLHIPVVTNPQVEFYLAGNRVVMEEGETWYLDFGQRHSVFNGGDEARVHLVLDCVVNDWLRRLIESS